MVRSGKLKEDDEMLNVAVLMGRMVRDPELKHTSDNVAVSTFSIAVDRDYKKEGQDREADFLDIVCWRSTAEHVCKYFKKGQLIVIQGSIQTRTYTDTKGNKRKAFEIVSDQVHFAGRNDDKDSDQKNPDQK